ncbi:lymphoid-restricted membrane protein isoform X2 [Agrilus planipennis]|uniref:Lymphoid-restricted membrane protein isoform X2 n=1 Tax=Agrilus planipennis TaxID=224129 RepID=A0A1W4XV45_AGRPL|nr:lymphoid-restricted membrane protein isoform X2 [Agrilus planipennis]
MFKLSNRPWTNEIFEEGEDEEEETDEPTLAPLDVLDTLTRKLRSLSDGHAKEYNTDGEFQVFPSLPDSVLQKLGLTGENTGIRLSEQEMEERFIALALAFSIDATTITDRWERQQRFRDQTEINFANEIDKLIEKVHKIQPLCVDAERAELLTNLLAQTDIVVKASSHATIAAERFGAVQHEHRLAQAAHLMINYVTALKQQRDSARKQLQYTKRVLQHTNSTDSMIVNKTRVSPTQTSNGNKNVATRRRASIATITQPFEGNLAVGKGAKFTRRTSDLSSRLTTLARSSRLSRLELGVDLSKIKEGIEAASRANSQEDKSMSENESEDEDLEETKNADSSEEFEDIDISNFTKKDKVVYTVRKFYHKIKSKYTTWAKNGVLHEIFSVGGIICFSLGLITLGNLMIEIEYAQRKNI